MHSLKAFLNKIWTKCSGRSKTPLAEILALKENREALLGARRPAELTKEDIGKVVRYSRSEDYAAWAEEAWLAVISLVDRLAADDPDLNADFYRGALAATLDLLKLSHKAHDRQAQSIQDEKRHVTARVNGTQ